jgi:hypothetical protein
MELILFFDTHLDTADILNGTAQGKLCHDTRDIFSGPGYPFNVRVSSPAVVYLTNNGFSVTVNLSIAGSLTVEFNATVDLSGYQAPFIINGNLLNQGTNS